MLYNIYDLDGSWLSHIKAESHSDALILAYKKNQSDLSWLYIPNHFYIVINEDYPTAGSVQLFKLVMPPIPEIFAERINDIDD